MATTVKGVAARVIPVPCGRKVGDRSGREQLFDDAPAIRPGHQPTANLERLCGSLNGGLLHFRQAFPGRGFKIEKQKSKNAVEVMGRHDGPTISDVRVATIAIDKAP